MRGVRGAVYADVHIRVEELRAEAPVSRGLAAGVNGTGGLGDCQLGQLRTSGLAAPSAEPESTAERHCRGCMCSTVGFPDVSDRKSQMVMNDRSIVVLLAAGYLFSPPGCLLCFMPFPLTRPLLPPPSYSISACPTSCSSSVSLPPSHGPHCCSQCPLVPASWSILSIG